MMFASPSHQSVESYETDLVEAYLDWGLTAEYHLEMVVEVARYAVGLLIVLALALDQLVVMEVRDLNP